MLLQDALGDILFDVALGSFSQVSTRGGLALLDTKVPIFDFALAGKHCQRQPERILYPVVSWSAGYE